MQRRGALAGPRPAAACRRSRLALLTRLGWPRTCLTAAVDDDELSLDFGKKKKKKSKAKEPAAEGGEGEAGAGAAAEEEDELSLDLSLGALWFVGGQGNDAPVGEQMGHGWQYFAVAAVPHRLHKRGSGLAAGGKPMAFLTQVHSPL